MNPFFVTKTFIPYIRCMDKMRYYFDFGVFNYIDKQDAMTVHYLKYVYDEIDNKESADRWRQLQTSETKLGSTFSIEDEAKPISIGLRVCEHDIKHITDRLPLPPDVDVLDYAGEYVQKKAFDVLSSVAESNKSLYNSTDFILDPTWDDLITYRKLLSKIFMMSNMIASVGRTGAGNFVLMSKETYKLLLTDSKPFTKPSDVLANLNILLCPIGDSVIVGRKSERKDAKENGIYIKCVTPGEADYSMDVKYNIIGVDVTYAIEVIGDKLPYVSFDIKYPENGRSR